MDGKYTKLLQKYIPGGAHTYSRGSDQFSKNAPEIFLKGKGAYLYDLNKQKFLDYGMGLRSVSIGYSEERINKAAIKQINNGMNLTRPSLIELKAAKKFVETIKSADMVKFTKNGSTAVTAAVKLSRAFTGKNIILRCADHPFFSYDDWFIGSTQMKRGIPNEIIKLTKIFKYNDINSLKKIVKKYRNNIAAVVLEPSNKICPSQKNESTCCGKRKCNRNFKKNNFLKDVEIICKENNIVFILDEMITGFRWSYYGAQKMYDVNPDLSTFGKAMSNGFPLAAVCGKEKIMELGSINKIEKERVFLLSTTFGAEMGSLGAFVETLNYIKNKNVIENNWSYGFYLKKIFNEISSSEGINEYLFAGGISCSPYYECLDKNKRNSLPLRTLLMQEMVKRKILFPSFLSISYRHSKLEYKKTVSALKKSIYTYKKALTRGVDKYLVGNAIKPVFRKLN